MSATMRAKMVVSSIVPSENVGGETLNFRAVCRDEGYGEDGMDENNTFAAFTPSAELQMYVNNPALQGEFKEGDTFYVDFTPAD